MWKEKMWGNNEKAPISLLQILYFVYYFNMVIKLFQ